jgi:hypothetical protein
MRSRAVIPATVVLTTVVALALAGVPAVTAWLYVLAWYPLLLLLDGLVVALGGPSLRSDPRALARMLGWSAVIWFGFEALNLRLENWYYVYVPASLPQRWAGTALAFATVVPAIVLPARLLERLGVAERLVTRPIPLGPRDLRLAAALGVVMLAAVLVAPRVLYPLAWGAVWLIAEPLLHRVDAEHSLFADIAAGRFTRIARLMLAGLAAGALWESLNALALTRWIYTVPLLEGLKVFEMPPVGFLGFPFFALEAWSLYYLLVARTRPAVVIAAVVGVVAVLWGMDRRTFSSTVPYARDLPGVAAPTAGRLEREGLGDAFRIVRAGVTALRAAGLPAGEAERLHAVARLAALRGIGAAHAAALEAAGIGSVEALAAADPERLWVALRAASRPSPVRPTAAAVRTWVRAARRAVSGT